MTVHARIAVGIALVLAAQASTAEVVLLTNGSLLSGRVQHRGEEVAVAQPGGSLVLRRSEVLTVQPSALAAYGWLRTERIRPGASANDHLALADWAMENGLWPQAARELLDARQIEPRSVRLGMMERRFDELTRPRPTTPPRPDRRLAAAQPEQPNIQAEPLPNLPEGSLEHFTRRIQPLLRNGCAAVGCHRGESGDALALDPRWVRGISDARSTDHNLRAVVAAIDFASPEASPLLAAARGSHYGSTPFAGPRREELVSRLEAWVRGVTAANPVEPTTDHVIAAVAEAEPADSLATTVLGDHAMEPASFDRPMAPVQRGVRLRRVGPRDEFDPAIFNERFRRPQDDLPLNE